jgi:cytochrome c-type biogenesis protein
MNDVSYPLAFVAGVLSFLSPCVLPLVPAYLSVVSGLTFEELQSSHLSLKTIKRITAFVMGFSTIFVAMGASSSLIGNLLLKYQDIVRIAGGVLIILFGLFVSGIIKWEFLMRERKFFSITAAPAGYAGVFFIGMTFAAGWTPCIGPILGTILVYAGSEGSASYGLKLLAVYSLGLAIPFFLSAIAVNIFLKYLQGIHRYFIRIIMIASGLILIVFGVMLLTNKVGQVSSLLPDLGIKM